MMVRLALFLLSCVLAAGASATGVLELINGDRVQGDFLRLKDGKLHWHSPRMGNLAVDVYQIRNITSTIPVKVDGTSTPCLIEGVEDEHLIYHCGGDPDPRRVPLAAMDRVLPFEKHVEGEYTYQGRLSLAGVYARGNEPRDDWKLNSNVTFRRAELRHNLSLEYATLSLQMGPTNRKWGGRYTLDWFFREQWFWYNDVSAGRDEVRGIQEYYTVGSGFGHQFWESRRTALSLTTGMTYVDETYQVPASPPADFERFDSRSAWRAGSDFRYRLPLGVSFTHRNEYILSVEDSEDWQLRSNTGVSTLLVGKLYSEFRLEYNVNNQPQPGKRREDRRLTVGLSYEW